MIAAALALALAAPPCALPARAEGPLPWGPGETLTYELDLLGLHTGMLDLSVERPMSGGRIVPLKARARSAPSLGAIRRIAAVAFSWIDSRTLVPEHYREESEDGGVHKVGDARLPPGAREVTVTYRVDDRESTATHAPTGPVLDPISTVYLLRASRLAPGAELCFDLVSRGVFWRVEAKVAPRRERIETPLGKLETLRVDAQARRADRPGAAARPIHLWFSTDPRRLLVAAVTEIDAGPVRLTLKDVRGAGRGR